METQTPSSSHSSPSPRSSGAFWSLFWGQGLWWLISALSGTLEIKAEGKRQQQEHELRMKTLQQEHELRVKTLQQENERLDGMILQTRKENEQLAILESKIDGLFSKYNINSKVHQTPEQP
jgi:TolA-binding protein